MSERQLFNGLLVAWFALAAGAITGLFFFVAPYGRHARGKWGPALTNTLGWILMEAPAPLVFAACFALTPRRTGLADLVFLALWEAHYLHRAFIYPWSLRGRAKRMSLAVVGSGFFFNGVNGYLNGRYIFTFSGGYPAAWLHDPRFLIGLIIFLTGFVINRQADNTLRQLRAPGESDYKIPYGGLYRWISSPNYLGEIVEWIGWAVATWSLSGLAFAVWTAANLVPRARAHHRWYRDHFPAYPAERKALVPHVW